MATNQNDANRQIARQEEGESENRASSNQVFDFNEAEREIRNCRRVLLCVGLQNDYLQFMANRPANRFYEINCDNDMDNFIHTMWNCSRTLDDRTLCLYATLKDCTNPYVIRIMIQRYWRGCEIGVPVHPIILQHIREVGADIYERNIYAEVRDHILHMNELKVIVTAYHFRLGDTERNDKFCKSCAVQMTVPMDMTFTVSTKHRAFFEWVSDRKMWCTNCFITPLFGITPDLHGEAGEEFEYEACIFTPEFLQIMLTK